VLYDVHVRKTKLLPKAKSLILDKNYN
jgi:hypothetical protein